MMKTSHRSLSHGIHQRGATLLIALIMLVLITLMVVASFKLGETDLKIVGNMQSRQQAQAAAQAAIDLAISRDLFVTQPDAVFLTPCSAGPNTQCADVNNDGKNDIVASLDPQPRCVVVSPIKTDDLDLSVEADLACSKGESSEGYSVSPTPSAAGESQCSDTIWEFRAEAVDSHTNARAVIRQGVGIRAANDKLLTACPLELE